jgi:hypothetical protein
MRALLGAYSLGALPVERDEALEAHLLRCPPCLMVCTELTKTATYLWALSEVDFALTANICRGVRSAHVDRPARLRPGSDDNRHHPGASTGDQFV